MQLLLPLFLLLSITLPSHGHTTTAAITAPSHVNTTAAATTAPSHVNTTAAAITAPAPSAPSPPASVIALMSKKSCKLFADLLTATADTATTFQQNVGSGLTVFCPNDAAVKAFAPKLKNLTADAKVSLLLFQAIPVYNSIPMLNSGNGVVNTLATDGTSKNYNFTVQNEGEAVTLNTGVNKADITETIVDADPLAVYAIDTMMEPRELFKVAHAPAPAPAPEADAPVAEKGAASPPAPTPAGPQSEPADTKKPVDVKASGVAGKAAGWRAAAAAAIAAAAMLMTV